MPLTIRCPECFTVLDDNGVASNPFSKKQMTCDECDSVIDVTINLRVVRKVDQEEPNE